MLKRLDDRLRFFAYGALLGGAYRAPRRERSRLSGQLACEGLFVERCPGHRKCGCHVALCAGGAYEGPKRSGHRQQLALGWRCARQRGGSASR